MTRKESREQAFAIVFESSFHDEGLDYIPENAEGAAFVPPTPQEMKAQIEPFFQVLFDANPKSIGGEMPADDFYYGVE